MIREPLGPVSGTMVNSIYAKVMSKRKTITHEVDGLADDARAFLAATAEVAGEKVAEARQRLNKALERCSEMCGNLRDQAVGAAQAADEAVHEKPYHAMGIALGAGVLIGLLIARRCSRSNGPE